MTERNQILVFGADAILVETRSRVLETAGFKVATSMSLMETKRDLTEKQIALLLLCHSLPSSDCEKAVDVALRLHPNIVIVLLSATSSPAIQRTDVTIHQIDGPKKLVETVRGLLA